MTNEDPYVKKKDPPKVIPRAATFRRVNARDPNNLYPSSLKYLRQENLYLQTADINDSVLSLSFSQNTHISYPRAIGRAARVLDQLAPEYIDTFKITNLNADMSMFTTEIPRDAFQASESLNLTSELMRKTAIYKEDSPTHHKEHKLATSRHVYQFCISLPCFRLQNFPLRLERKQISSQNF